MADLKAAAKFCQASSCDSFITDEQTDFLVLAAQALEAWAWVEENGWRVEYDVEDRWCCISDVFTRYYADTPLGAVLAAMEGESQ